MVIYRSNGNHMTAWYLMAADGLCHSTSPPFSQYKFSGGSSVNNTTTTSQYDMKKFIKKKTELLFNNLT